MTSQLQDQSKIYKTVPLLDESDVDEQRPLSVMSGCCLAELGGTLMMEGVGLGGADLGGVPTIKLKAH